MLGVVALLAVVDLVGTAAALRAATQLYGLVGPGMSRDEVRYAMGPPAAVRQAATGTTWLYHQGSGRFQVDFAPSGLFDRVACSSDVADGGDCPDVLGIRLGSGEDQIWYALGAPDRQSYAGETKLISYGALGLTFGLRRLQVVSISLSAAADGAYLKRLPRVLMP